MSLNTNHHMWYFVLFLKWSTSKSIPLHILLSKIFLGWCWTIDIIETPRDALEAVEVSLLWQIPWRPNLPGHSHGWIYCAVSHRMLVDFSTWNHYGRKWCVGYNWKRKNDALVITGKKSNFDLLIRFPCIQGEPDENCTLPLQIPNNS